MYVSSLTYEGVRRFLAISTIYPQSEDKMENVILFYLHKETDISISKSI